jgi:hypothetical protein
VRNVGHEILPHLVQSLDLGEIVEHQDHRPVLLPAQLGRGHAHPALPRRPEPQVGLDRLPPAARRVHEVHQLRGARELLERRTRRRRERRAQDRRQALVGVHQAVVGIDQGDAVAHVGEDPLALVTLPLERLEPPAQLGGHGVDRGAEPPQLVRRQLARARGRVARADPDRHLLEIAGAPRLPARHAVRERHADQQRDHRRH